MTLLNIENLSVSYGDRVVFDDFSQAFAGGKISVILGGSGVGKTTLLNAVAGLLPYGGKIDLGGQGVSYIFQSDRLVKNISVYKNLELVLKATVKDRKERRRRIEETLALLEIEDEAKKLPTELSGGQAQRVAMARAYLFDADILLLDEPFKALDTALKARLIAQLIALNEKKPRTIVFVTHAIDECLLTADDWYVLSGSPAGICASGSIDIPKEERKLSSPALATVREELLKAIESCDF